MKAVLLDAATLGDDVDLRPVEAQVASLQVHARTGPSEVTERLAGADIALTNKVVIDADTIAALPRLKLICVLATGTNNVDVDAAKRHGVRVANVSAYGNDSVAQHTLMMMLALATRLPLYQRDVAAGHWNTSPSFGLSGHRVLQLAGKRLVIVGSGQIGRRVASLAEAFGMHVDFCARPGAEAGDPRPALAKLAPEADVISLHCPLTPATRHLVDTALIGRLRPGTLLINCARGGILDEHAALAALREERIGGLAVDVLPEEPPRHGHALIDALDEPLNLVVTPHSAWLSPEARQTIVHLSADNIARFRNSPGA